MTHYVNNIKELTSSIDTVLWEQWDPIGVNNSPEARDEYSTYSLKLAGMVYNQASKQDILDYLFYVEHKLMGLCEEQDNNTIEKRNIYIVDKILSLHEST